MKETISGDGKQYRFDGTAQELRDLVQSRKENLQP